MMSDFVNVPKNNDLKKVVYRDFGLKKINRRPDIYNRVLHKQRSQLMQASIHKNRIEQYCYENFSVNIRIKNIVARKLLISKDTYLIIFFSEKGSLYGLLTSQNNLDLIDIQKMIKASGIEANYFLPPKGDVNYFTNFGKKKYQIHFPAKTEINDQDIEFYQTLAPYNPALFKINKISRNIKYRDQLSGRLDKEFDYSFTNIKVNYS